MSPETTTLVAAGREIQISNPEKVLFPHAGHTKLDLAHYYLAVAPAALRAAEMNCEAIFKATARALRMAVESDPRMRGVPSTKGTL